LNRWRHFKSYVNLRATEDKLRYLLNTFEFTSLVNLIDERESLPISAKAASAGGL
jgi:hypothetical protein